MKTTIYELLGMIKDNKVPKKIIYRKKLWKYDIQDKDYWTNSYDGTEWLFDEYIITDILNEEATILETTITYKQDKKIEKLGFENTTTPTSASENEAFLMTCINFVSIKIDEIIDFISKEEK